MMDNMQLDEVNCREWCVAVRQTRGLTGLVLMGELEGGRSLQCQGLAWLFSAEFLFGVRVRCSCVA